MSADGVHSGRYKLLDINLIHPIRTTQLAISHFLEKKKAGNILHISSIAGQVANPVTPLVSLFSIFNIRSWEHISNNVAFSISHQNMAFRGL